MRLTAAVCASLLLATPALAQPTPTPQQKQQAGDLVKQAIAKSQSGEHQAAIDLYLQAYAIVPLPLLLSNVASEWKALQKPVESLRYFCKYLEAEPTGTNAAYATSEAKVLQIQLGNPIVDDKDVCAPPKAPPPPPPNPKLEQKHEITGTTSDESPGRTLEYTGGIVAGLGVLGLAVGVYFGLEASSISKEISNHDPTMPWPDNINDREKTGQSDENKQILFLVMGGIAVGAGAILYVMGHAKNSEHTTQLVLRPVATPDTVGFALDGRF